MLCVLGALTLLAGPVAWAQPGRQAVDPLASRVDPHVARVRLLVLTDIANEPDDQMSLVRLLVYGNHFDIEGLVATTSTWLKTGVRPDVLHTVLDAYAQVQPNLLQHAPGFPAAADLKRLVAAGQPGYGMAATGAGKTSPGAALLLAAMRRDDPRPLWVTAWGGTNTLAQALIDARAQSTPEQLRTLVSRLRVYAISDQDDAGAWLRREFPDLHFIGIPSTQDGQEYTAATWTGISGDRFYRNAPGADFRTFTDDWVERQHPRSRAARQALSVSLLHPRGRHAVVPRPHRQRPRQRDEPDVRRLGRPVRVASAAWGAAGVLDAGRRCLSGARRRRATPCAAVTARCTPRIRRRSGAGERRSSTTSRRAWRGRSCLARRANHNPQVVVNGAAGTAPILVDARVGTPVALDARETRDPDGHALTFRWWYYPEAGTGIPGRPVLTAPAPGRRRAVDRTRHPRRRAANANRRACRSSAATRRRRR